MPSKILFEGTSNGVSGLWITDGTTAGTHQITGIVGASAGNFYPVKMAAFNGQALFDAIDANGVAGLWVTDGTAAGTQELVGINGAYSGGLFRNFQYPNFTVFNNEVLFSGINASGVGGLWATDGTAVGTHEITSIGGVYEMAALGAMVIFAGRDSNSNPNLSVTDGTAAGTHELTGITGFQGAGNLTAFNGQVLFEGKNANNALGLWVTDGTAAGSHELTGISGASNFGLLSSPDGPNFTVFGGKVLFDGVDANGRVGIWQTDGTVAGTNEIVQHAGSTMAAVNEKVVFIGFDGYLWVTDGTDAGTSQLTSVHFFASLNGTNFLTSDGKVYFSPSSDYGLWVTDGTALGTYEITPQINPAYLTSLAETGSSGVTRSGSEFVVNTTTAGNQLLPTITALSDGHFVVAWEDTSATGDSSNWAIRAQVFNADGSESGAEFLVNTSTGGYHEFPGVTALNNGRFVVTWDEFSQNNGEIRAQIFNSDGSKSGTEFLVDTATSGYQISPKITALSNGGFVVAWTDGSGLDVSSWGLAAQAFDANGNKSGAEFLVNTTTLDFQYNQEVTALTNGNFVVAWTDGSMTGGDTSGSAVRAQVFNASGSTLGAEFLVNTTTAGDQSGPGGNPGTLAIAGLADGRFVVAWGEDGNDAPSAATAIRAQIFNSDGSKSGVEFLVNTATASNQSNPTIAGLPDGRFVVGWTDGTQTGGDTSGSAVRAQVFNADGSKSGADFLVNTTTVGFQNFPTIESLASDRFVVAWQDASQSGADTAGYAVRAQIFDAGRADTTDTVLDNINTSSVLLSTLPGAIDAEPKSGSSTTLSDGAGGLVDKDWYRVNLVEGHTYRFDGSSTSISTGSVALALYDQSGSKVAGIYNNGASQYVEGSNVSFKFDASAQTNANQFYYLAVSAGGTEPLWRTATGAYSIGLTDLGAASYSVSPTPAVINENQGTFTFRITRSDFSQPATVFVSTARDQGYDNPGNDTFYKGILNEQIDFAVNQSFVDVPLSVHDLGLSSGSEKFRLVVQQGVADPLSTSVASTTFTIVNNDAAHGSQYSITLDPAVISESAGSRDFTIHRTDRTAPASVYVSTYDDQGASNSGSQYYNDLNKFRVDFQVGQTDAPVPLNIHDVHLTTGQESFRIAVQASAADASSTYLTSKIFTIKNDDTPPTPVSSPPDLVTLAELSTSVYDFNPANYVNYTLLKKDNADPSNIGYEAAAFSSPDGHQIVIAIRGTAEPKNLLSDVSFPTGIVDASLSKLVSDAANFVYGIAHDNPGASITLTGHSLGGGIAQLVGEAAKLPTIVFNAPGGANLYPQLTSELAVVAKTGSPTENINYRVFGDQVSLAGSPIGQTLTIEDSTSKLINDAVVLFAWLDFHSLDHGVLPAVIEYEDQLSPDVKLVAGRDGPDVTDKILAAVALGAVAGPVGALVSFAATFIVDAALTYLVDPDSSSRVVISESQNSPLITSIQLPGEPNVTFYTVSAHSSGGWTNLATILPGSTIDFGVAVDSISVSAFGANGLPTALPQGYFFGLTFASSGQADLTLTIPASSNHAPVVTAHDVTPPHPLQSFPVSSLFSVSDADGDTATQYQLWDSTTSTNSGHWVVGGVAQGTNVAIDVTAAQFVAATFLTGSVADDVFVRAFDGVDWGPWTEFHINAPVNRAPMVGASDSSVNHNQNVAASSLFSVTDADNDTIVAYQFWDSTSDSASGHWIVGGVSQGTNSAIDVTPAQFGSATFQSGSGADDLWVRANDGFDWSAWKEFHVTAPIDHPPVATAPNVVAAHGEELATASSLFSVTDADNDTIVQYGLWDSTGSGYWVVNGVAQGTNVNINITAAQLAQTSYQFGAGTDQLWVRANDGIIWGTWQPFTASSFTNHAPVVTASDFAATHNQNVAASSLLTVSDVDNDTITAYQFWDSTSDPASGHWVINGVAQGTNQAIDVSAAQLANTTFQSGSGSDDLWVRANDGTAWGQWKEFHVNAPLDRTPVVTATDFAATHSQSVAATSLCSVSDADNDPIAAYQFWDSTLDSASGHWMVGGVAQGTNQAINVTPAQLGSATFQSGSGSDDLWVRANDGTAWGAWKEFHVNAPIDQTPVVTANDLTATHNQNIAASSLFSVTDADNDSIAKYQVWDSTADPASGHWVVGGATQGANAAIDVTSAQLASATFQSGSGSDDLWVRANDGFVWSNWKEFHVNAPVDQAPVVTASNFNATSNQTVAASGLFSVTDAEHDSIAKYQFWDSTANAASGHWNIGGAAQGTNVAIDVSAAQLASTAFQGGTMPDDLWVRANDGTQWSQWQEFHWIV